MNLIAGQSQSEIAKSLIHFGKIYARKRNYQQDADDFGQEYAIAILNGRHTHIENILTDYLRRTYGNTRSLSGSQRVRNNLSKPIEPDTIVQSKGSSELSAGFDCRKLLAHLTQIDHSIYILRYMWGFNEAEIAYCYKVTESRICQRLQRIQSSLSKRTQEKSGSKSQRKNSLQEIYGEKGKIISRIAFKRMAEKESREMARMYETGYHQWLT